MDATRTAYEDGTIDDLRSIDSDKYDLIEIEFPFGKRRCLQKKNQADYLLIQKSRCGSVGLEEEISIEENLKKAEENTNKILPADEIRIKELDFCIEKQVITLPERPVFSELGFRCAKLMKYYKQNCNMKVFGFDVIESNIAVASCLGYDAFVYDFNECDKKLDLNSSDLLVSYHMLEHVTNPLKAIKKIYDSMKKGSYFHVEVPVEPWGPNIRYCHMYPFHQDDLLEMLKIAGFKILTISKIVQKGGQDIDRILVEK